LAPPWRQCARPIAQKAFFLATGWGQAPNRAAERIFLALRLRNHSEWEISMAVEDLFPLRRSDPFLDFLLDVGLTYASIASAAMLDRIYSPA
jgi:hypothetical protein